MGRLSKHVGAKSTLNAPKSDKTQSRIYRNQQAKNSEFYPDTRKQELRAKGELRSAARNDQLSVYQKAINAYNEDIQTSSENLSAAPEKVGNKPTVTSGAPAPSSNANSTEDTCDEYEPCATARLNRQRNNDNSRGVFNDSLGGTFDKARVKLDEQLSVAKRSPRDPQNDLNYEIICAKSGRVIGHATNELSDLYAQTNAGNDLTSLTWGILHASYAPHMVNTSPENLIKISLIDPCGLFVYLTCKVIGDNKKSIDDMQSAAKFDEKMMLVQERRSTFAIASNYYAESEENRLQIAACNALLMKIIGLSNFRQLMHRNVGVKPLFYSATNCIKDINAYGLWLQSVYDQIITKVAKGSGFSSAEFERFAQNNRGNTAMRIASVGSNNSVKRKFLRAMGFSGVIMNDILDMITEEELGINSNSNTFDIEKINDPEHRKRIERLIQRKSDPEYRAKRAENARKRKEASEELAKMEEIFDNIAF